MKESQCSVKTKMKMALALKELMETMSFDKITVSDITDKCDIHRQTFYYHFQDKHEILEWYVSRELFEPFLNGFNFENMYNKFNIFFTTMYENKKFYQSVLKIDSANIIDFISKLIKGEFNNLMSDLGRSKNIPSSNESEIFSEFFGYGLAGIAIQWAKEGMKKKPQELTGEIMYLVETCKKLQLDEN